MVRPAQDGDLGSTATTAPAGATITFAGSSQFVNFLNQQLSQDNTRIVTIGIRAETNCSSPTVPSQQFSASTASGGTVTPVLTLDTIPLAGTLASFQTLIQSNGILLTWESSSEINTQGYYVYRATGPNGQPIELTYIASQAPGAPSPSDDMPCRFSSERNR